MANNSTSADLESASKYSEKSKDDVLVGVVPAVLPSGERKTTVKRALKSRHMQLMLVFHVHLLLSIGDALMTRKMQLHWWRYWDRSLQ